MNLVRGTLLPSPESGRKFARYPILIKMVCKKLKKGKCKVLDEPCKQIYARKMGIKPCAISKKKPVKKKVKTKAKKKVKHRAKARKKKRR